MPLTVTPQEPDSSAPASAGPVAVSVEQVSKRFVLPHQHYSTLKERALHPLRSRSFDTLHAVNDVSFQVHSGEFFGIVGRNGSGKSTLLKVLAGIYEADDGRARVSGRLSPFIELGVGFNPDLTARDNVIVNAIMLGLTRKEARERFDEIIAFAELEEFLDLKLKNYSSGMSVRLAFSVAIQVDADVLLIDEVLAVGDIAFQQKCFDQFHRLKEQGKTIVFVTHDMSAVERFCDRAMLIERGNIVTIDEPHAVATAYNELNFGRVVLPQSDGSARSGDHAAAEIKAAWFEDGGERVSARAAGRHAGHVHAGPLPPGRSWTPGSRFHLRNEARHTVFATGSTAHVAQTGAFRAGETVTVRAELDNWFAQGRYTLTPTVARPGGADVLDLREDLGVCVVHGVRQLGGILEVPHTFAVERS